MTNPPEAAAPSSSRAAIMGLLVILVGGGMYFLGRHPRALAQSSPQGEGQTAQKTLDDAQSAGSPATGSAGKGADGRHLAPRDTFYLLQYASAKTPTGVIGFEPGQEVHLVEVHQASRTLVVGDGEAQVEVGPEKLTNDLDIAALVRQKDQANQAKIAAYIQQEQTAYEASKKEAAVKTEQELDKIDERKQAAAVAANNAAARNQPTGTGVNAPTKLDEPPVTVEETSGYGSAGSAYYGSPYSYFGGGTATATGGGTAPANTGAAGGGNARAGGSANVGH